MYVDDVSKTYLHTMLLHILLFYICFHVLFGQLINQAGGALTGLLDVSNHTLTGNVNQNVPSLIDLKAMSVSDIFLLLFPSN